MGLTLAHFVLISLAVAFVSASLYTDEPAEILKRTARIILWLTLGIAAFSLFVQILGGLVL